MFALKEEPLGQGPGRAAAFLDLPLVESERGSFWVDGFLTRDGPRPRRRILDLSSKFGVDCAIKVSGTPVPLVVARTLPQLLREISFGVGGVRKRPAFGVFPADEVALRAPEPSLPWDLLIFDSSFLCGSLGIAARCISPVGVVTVMVAVNVFLSPTVSVWVGGSATTLEETEAGVTGPAGVEYAIAIGEDGELGGEFDGLSVVLLDAPHAGLGDPVGAAPMLGDPRKAATLAADEVQVVAAATLAAGEATVERAITMDELGELGGELGGLPVAVHEVVCEFGEREDVFVDERECIGFFEYEPLIAGDFELEDADQVVGVIIVAFLAGRAGSYRWYPSLVGRRCTALRVGCPYLPCALQAITAAVAFLTKSVWVVNVVNPRSGFVDDASWPAAFAKPRVLLEAGTGPGPGSRRCDPLCTVAVGILAKRRWRFTSQGGGLTTMQAEVDCVRILS